MRTGVIVLTSLLAFPAALSAQRGLLDVPVVYAATLTRNTPAETFRVCQVIGEDAEARDLDLYVVGLNHHGPDAASGAAEEDLQRLADTIIAASPNAAKVIVASTGTNPKATWPFMYIDGNLCPANRLQHLLEEKTGLRFTGLGVDGVFPHGCQHSSEYRVITGSDWNPAIREVRQFNLLPRTIIFTRAFHMRGRTSIWTCIQSGSTQMTIETTPTT